MVWVIIPAAGQGKRMGAGINKVLLPLLDRPVLAWTLAAIQQAETIQGIVLVGQPHDRDPFLQVVQDYGIDKSLHFVVGGTTRQESVGAGIDWLQQQGWEGGVLVHDGARCLATPDLLNRCATALATELALVAAIPVKDTIKVAQPTSGSRWQVVSTPDRSHLWAAQTPQGSRLSLLAQAHAQARQAGWDLTDDVALLEQLGIPVTIIVGEETNLKLTTPADRVWAETILQQRYPGEKGVRG
ncbi:MAG: 2-C-methyl-D-erythritol 4-phosphate cytidylyltransferase [Thermostichales cyanobacterium BF4_bins_65]